MPLCWSEPYWINGSPIKKNCKNFLIASFSFDANLHVLGHASENLINFAFKGDSFHYNVEYNDYTQEAYEKLTYWEKFTLIDKYSKNQNSGVGNIHFPFNGFSDYDYTNTTLVYTNWENWLEYPNLNYTKKKSNCSAWMTFSGNSQILKNPLQNQDPDRLYIRFWMYLIPHIDGYTEDGFLNNWWGYFTNIDYVTKIDTNNRNIYGVIGKELELNYNVYYSSGDVENVKYTKKDKNVRISGNCANFVDNKLIGVQQGKCSVSIYRDGKNVSFTVNIKEVTIDFSSLSSGEGYIVNDNTVVIFTSGKYILKGKNTDKNILVSSSSTLIFDSLSLTSTGSLTPLIIDTSNSVTMILSGYSSLVDSPSNENEGVI